MQTTKRNLDIQPVGAHISWTESSGDVVVWRKISKATWYEATTAYFTTSHRLAHGDAPRHVELLSGVWEHITTIPVHNGQVAI